MKKLKADQKQMEKMTLVASGKDADDDDGESRAARVVHYAGCFHAR